MSNKRLGKLALAAAVGLGLVLLLLVALRSCGPVADFGAIGSRAVIVTPSAPISTTGWVTNSVVISDITGLVTFTTDFWVTWTPVGAPLSGCGWLGGLEGGAVLLGEHAREVAW